MQAALADHPKSKQKRDHAQDLKKISDATAEVLRSHAAGEIDSDEAALRLYELKTRNRTFLDRLVG